MVRKYVKHPRPKKPIKTKCGRDWERAPRRYTLKDICRISKYVKEDYSPEIVAATIFECVEMRDNLCQLPRFVSASLLLIEAVGEIAAISAVGVALEKAYRLLMGVASKVPQIRIVLAGLIVAIIFLRSVIGAIEAMIETSAGVRDALDSLTFLCTLSEQTGVSNNDANDDDDEFGDE